MHTQTCTHALRGKRDNSKKTNRTEITNKDYTPIHQVIGGGTALSRRIAKSGMPTNVFGPIDALSAKERGEMRNRFAEAMDAAAAEGVVGGPPKSAPECSVEALRERARAFMDLNNALMAAVRVRPWWAKYMAAGLGAAAVGGVAVLAKWWLAN